MRINWRKIRAAGNSYAVLSAACEASGYTIHPVGDPRSDVTCYSLNSISARHYLAEIRNAECITIAGGPHSSACYPELTRFADYVIVGEGEYTLPLLLTHIEDGKSGAPRGVATADGFEPAETTVRLDGYAPFSQTNGYVEISRGCPFGCTYCQTPRLFGAHIRHRSLDQIARYAARYRHARFVSPNAFGYGSDDGIHPRFDRIERLLRRLKNQNQIYFGTFPSEVRPEFIREESVDLVTTYCTNTRLHFGAQSGSDSVLKRLGRGHTVADVIAAVETCSVAGILPVVDFIVGLPDETDEEQRDTLSLIEWVTRSGMVHIHQFIPLPGTPLFKALPRSLLPETVRALGKLSITGKLTGSWSDPEIRFFRNPPNDIT